MSSPRPTASLGDTDTESVYGRMHEARMGLESANRILLCLRYGIGDLAMELPAIAGLRATVPSAQITGLGARPAIELLEGEMWLDSLTAVQEFGYREWADGGNERSNGRFREWFRAHGFDAVLDPSHTVFGAASVIWREGAPQMYDVSREMQSGALAGGLRGYDAVRESVRQGWGLTPAAMRPSLSLTDVERAAAECMLVAADKDRKPLAAVATAASSALKRWPVVRFAAVAERLAHWGYDVITIGAPEETREERRVLSHHTTCFPPCHLRVTAALLERCDLLVCNDTGLMHLAAAVGCKVVPIFGPTSPSIYAPPGSLAVGERDPPSCRKDTEFGPPDCVVHGSCRHGTPGCIARVGVDAVLEAVERMTHGGIA